MIDLDKLEIAARMGSRMKEEERKRINDIMGQMQCPKDFSCASSGFANLCKARDFGLDNYLECLEVNPLECTFALPFGDIHLCQCPLRVHLSKKLNM